MSASTASSATLHGYNLEYVDAGQGPAVLFVHGLLGTHLNWSHLIEVLSDGKRVIAPDLFGHGASAKPMGDYSLGAHAGTLRDLLDHLGVDRVTLVGHSLGGGVALQFTYLFPERVERLVLVSSGGLGRELSLLLRAATLPGSEFVLPLVASSWVRDRGATMGKFLSRFGMHAGPDLTEAWRGLASLNNAESRRAFLATSRAVIDAGGQTVAAGNRLALASRIPTLLVWGGRDRIIPPAHAVNAQLAIPGSRLEIFERAGHFPHLDDPERFARLVREFIADDGEVSGEPHPEELRYGDE